MISKVYFDDEKSSSSCFQIPGHYVLKKCKNIGKRNAKFKLNDVRRTKTENVELLSCRKEKTKLTLTEFDNGEIFGRCFKPVLWKGFLKECDEFESHDHLLNYGRSRDRSMLKPDVISTALPMCTNTKPDLIQRNAQTDIMEPGLIELKQKTNIDMKPLTLLRKKKEKYRKFYVVEISLGS